MLEHIYYFARQDDLGTGPTIQELGSTDGLGTQVNDRSHGNKSNNLEFKGTLERPEIFISL